MLEDVNQGYAWLKCVEEKYGVVIDEKMIDVAEERRKIEKATFQGQYQLSLVTSIEKCMAFCPCHELVSNTSLIEESTSPAEKTLFVLYDTSREMNLNQIQYSHKMVLD